MKSPHQRAMTWSDQGLNLPVEHTLSSDIRNLLRGAQHAVHSLRNMGQGMQLLQGA